MTENWHLTLECVSTNCVKSALNLDSHVLHPLHIRVFLRRLGLNVNLTGLNLDFSADLLRFPYYSHEIRSKHTLPPPLVVPIHLTLRLIHQAKPELTEICVTKPGLPTSLS